MDVLKFDRGSRKARLTESDVQFGAEKGGRCPFRFRHGNFWRRVQKISLCKVGIVKMNFEHHPASDSFIAYSFWLPGLWI